MNTRVYLNDDWKFSPGFSKEMMGTDYDASSMQTVRVPHNVKDLPLHYFNEADYQMICAYRRELRIPASYKGERLLLTFDGVGHDVTVFINGKEAGSHHCGYTAFTIDITNLVNYGADNVVALKVNTEESQNYPPFGFVIDYLTYGGIYRDVYLEVRSKVYIKDVFNRATFDMVPLKYEEVFGEDDSVDDSGLEEPAFNPELEGAVGDLAKIKIKNRAGKVYAFLKSSVELSEMPLNAKLVQYIRFKKNVNSGKGAGEWKKLGEAEVSSSSMTFKYKIEGIKLWDIDDPNLYEIKTELVLEKPIDELINTIGFREAMFLKDGFYLNGRKVKIRGLNRHQSYAYVGYAMPASMQKRDADILKKELCVNAVRTSHYPQSQYFIDRCDELGLLVFTEMPGWQHIGDEAWKDQAVTNTREMVLQYRNHPSIILWGVRINESPDDDAFYRRTNKAAHDLDPSRQTGGVRAFRKSHLLEDVYTYNDFSHCGYNAGVEPKRNITSRMDKPYMITEHNGHMYPVKSFDDEEQRRNQAIRHARVINDMYAQEDISGCFGWCMFDYNTHKDFGSGDKICYHGVMDIFRNKKLASYLYESQGEDHPVLEVSSSMDIGEHPASTRGIIYIFTNADSVRMYKNDLFLKEYYGYDTEFSNMPHGPIVIDDYIGDQLITNEGFSKKQSDLLKEIFKYVSQHGMNDLPVDIKAKAARLMAVYHMKMQDATDLYTKYVGDWGGKSTTYKFEAVKDGEVVKTIYKAPMRSVFLTANSDKEVLHDVKLSGSEFTDNAAAELSDLTPTSYDVAAVRIQVVDDNGNVLPFFNDPVTLELKSKNGAAEIIGPKVISLSGGVGGTYIKTTGVEGEAELIIRSEQAGEVTLSFTVSK